MFQMDAVMLFCYTVYIQIVLFWTVIKYKVQTKCTLRWTVAIIKGTVKNLRRRSAECTRDEMDVLECCINTASCSLPVGLSIMGNIGLNMFSLLDELGLKTRAVLTCVTVLGP